MCDHHSRQAETGEPRQRSRQHVPHIIFARGLIRIYRLTFSAILGRQCRYLPTCSEFTEDAIARHGLWAGGWMGARRIGSCNPWGGSGFDPVPEELSPDYRWWRPWRGR